MLPNAVHEFSEKVARQFGDRCVAVVLSGSFARGDDHGGSDVDLLVLLDSLTTEDLRVVGQIVRDIQSQHEVNPAVVDILEYQRYPDLFDHLSYKHDGILLFGRLPDVLSCRETELQRARRIAQEVLMSARHYIAVSEPEAKLRSGKLFTYIQKPLSYALRYYHYSVHVTYVRPYSKLAEVYPVLSIDGANQPQELLEAALRSSLEILDLQP